MSHGSPWLVEEYHARVSEALYSIFSFIRVVIVKLFSENEVLIPMCYKPSLSAMPRLSRGGVVMNDEGTLEGTSRGTGSEYLYIRIAFFSIFSLFSAMWNRFLNFFSFSLWKRNSQYITVDPLTRIAFAILSAGYCKSTRNCEIWPADWRIHLKGRAIWYAYVPIYVYSL